MILTNEEVATIFAKNRTIPNQTNIQGEMAIRYAHDAAMDMAEYKNKQMIQIFNFISPYLPEHIREETLELIKKCRE